MPRIGLHGVSAIGAATVPPFSALIKDGKPAGILSFMLPQTLAYFDQGFVFIGASSDTFMLARQAAHVVASLKA